MKLETTLRLLTAIKTIDKAMIESMDRITINSLYDEKILIFDYKRNLIYSSLDQDNSTQIPYPNKILNKLSLQNRSVRQKDKLYDVVGIYLEQDGKDFYGISKSYDASGYMVMHYLKMVLIFSFFGTSLILTILVYYLSGKITRSILQVTRQIKDYNFETNENPIVTTNTNDEIALLVKRFNELMSKMNKAHLFQKHAIHHISHELKTPISILVSNFEKIEKETNLDKIKAYIKTQKEDTKSLSDIINSLLEIAKVESGKDLRQSNVRVDELLFDISDELSTIHSFYKFSIEYNDMIEDERALTVLANPRLLKAALSNLMFNCSQYSNDGNARIIISTAKEKLQIDFINNGMPISIEEQQYLFQHFFRGQNSKGKRGFGLGLVFVHKIVSLHKGQIKYSIDGTNTNIFTIIFSLS
ncbi:MAG TPA: HAMP domain-containing sensor histidine kinase [Bacteroidales bacterium]